MAKTLTTSWQNIASYTVYPSGYTLTFYVDARYTSQSIANNTTTIETRLRSVASGSPWSSDYHTFECSYANTVSNHARWTYGTETITSGGDTIQHNNDGTKSVWIQGRVYDSAWGWNQYFGDTCILPTIARASSVACSSPYIGDTAIITVDKKASNFTNTVTYDIDGITGTIATKTLDTVLFLDTSSLKSQIYALIPNAKSITGAVYCTTYNGDTQIGSTQSATFNLYAVEQDCKPTVSAVVVDTNQDTIDLTGSSTIIVKNASKPKVTITATPNYSATISSYSINLNDGQTSNQQEHTFDTINSNSIIVDATDSREYNNPQTIDISNRVIDYVKLHFNTIELKRPESTSNQVILNANGVWFNGDFSQSNSNTLSCSFKYKKSTDNSWTNGGTITPTVSNNTFTFTSLSLGSSYDYNYEYQFKIIAEDLLMTVGSDNRDAQTVPKGIPVVEIGDELVNVNGTLTVNDAPLFDPLSVYPVGSIYLSVNSTNPSTLFGGTWQQITDDAYLKIVSSNAGDLGGTASNHKIPLTSMPSHDHTVNGGSHRHQYYNTWRISAGAGTASSVSGMSEDGYSGSGNYTNYDGGHTHSVSSSGGGQAYYPYYYGIYVWKRTA